MVTLKSLTHWTACTMFAGAAIVLVAMTAGVCISGGPAWQSVVMLLAAQQCDHMAKVIAKRMFGEE